MKKSTIVLWLEDITDQCVKNLSTENHFDFKKNYKSFVDYSEFCFSVLSYREGNYATQIRAETGLFSRSLFNYIFELNDDIFVAAVKKFDENKENAKNILRFYSRFLKHAVSGTDLSEIIQWQLVSYYRYAKNNRVSRNDTYELSILLVEGHEEVLKYLPHLLNKNFFNKETKRDNYYRAICDAYFTSLKWLTRLYVQSVYDQDSPSCATLRDCILAWPETVLQSFDAYSYFDRQGQEFLSLKDMDVNFEGKSEKEIKFYFYRIIKNYWKDMLLLGVIKELEYLVNENLHFPLMEEELRDLWCGKAADFVPQNERHSKPFENAQTLFIAYIRALFVNSSMDDIYSRFFDQITEKRSLIGRVHVRSISGLRETSIEPFIYMISSFKVNQDFSQAVVEILKKLPNNEASPAQDEIKQHLEKTIQIITTLQQNKSEHLYKRSSIFFLNDMSAAEFSKNLEIIKTSFTNIIQTLQETVSDNLSRAQIDSGKLLNIASMTSKAFSLDVKGVILKIFSDLRPTGGKHEKYIETINGWPKRDLLRDDHDLYRKLYGTEGYFLDVGKNIIHKILYHGAFSHFISHANNVKVGDAQGYWEQLKYLIRSYSGQGLTPILFLDNRTRPRWIYDWCDEYGGLNKYDRPKDFSFSKVKSYKDQAGYVGTINDKMHVVYVPGFIQAGKSLVFSGEAFKRFSLKERALHPPADNEKLYFDVRSIERQDKSDVVNLQVECEYELEVDLNSPATLISYQEIEEA